ncbi:MAG: TPR end-of-group domain-containing protein [Ktedonobacterales bacterium]
MDGVEPVPRLLALIAAARSEQQAFIAGLTDEQHAEVGSLSRWSAKDLVAHVSSWWRTQGTRIEQMLSGTELVSFDWSDKANAEVFTTNKLRSWAYVEAEAAASVTLLRDAVARVSAEQLLDPAYTPALEGRPLWRLVLGNGYLHPQTHLAQHFVERGEIERAAQLHETMAAAVAALDTSPAMRGMALYNLACFYATTQRAGDAIARLAEAFPLDASLVEWSRHDADLDSLRALPAFQMLYGR